MTNKKNKKIDVMWVGLSDKKEKNGEKFLPLNENTNSGKILFEIERGLPELNFHKTNLVKFAPVDENGKLRYPTVLEMEKNFSLLQKEIEELKPQLVFLLGSRVVKFVFKKKGQKLIKTQKGWQNYENLLIENIYFVPIFHPSYVHVYKRKKIDEYVETVRYIISGLLSI